MLIILVFLIIIGLIIYGVVAWRRREHVAEIDPGIGTVRRLYFYAVAFVALMMAANGVVLLVRFVLDGLFGGTLVSSSNAMLAGGVSLTAVGLPLWIFHFRLIQRYVREIQVESRSLLRKLYMYLTMAVSGALIINSAVQLLRWAFGAGDFSGYHGGAVIIWAAVWAFHWRIEEAEGQATPDTLGVRRLYLYMASLATLAMLSFGVGRIAYLVLLEGYDALTSATILLSDDTGLWRPALRGALAVGIVGGLTWGLHWLYLARRDFGSALRQLYLYIFAILGGVITILTALAVALSGVLIWLLGGADDAAALHFRFLPGVVATLAVGVALWVYHWTVVQREVKASPQEELDARRAYVYIVSGIGLTAMAIGVFLLVGAALDLVVDSFSQVIAGREGLRREPLAWSITLLALGGPLWGYYWASAQRLVKEGGAGETLSLARRIFVFAALGAGVLALLGSLSTALFLLLRDVLEGRLTSGTVDDLTIPIAIIVTAIIFVPYYWNVYRQDRDAVPPEARERLARPVRKEVTVLVAAGDDVVARLQAALGYRVNVARWADADAATMSLSDDDCRQVASRVAAAPGRRVMVIPEGAGGAGMRVVSYG